MTTEHETLRVIGSWMEEGRTRLPDHVLDAVLEQLPSTPQRRPARSVWRITQVHAIARTLVTAAAVVVVAIVGSNLVSGPGAGGQPSPSPTASPRPFTEGVLDSGRYAIRPFPWPNDDLTVTFTVPDGWAFGGSAMTPTGSPGTGAPGGIAIQFIDVTTLNTDPCRWEVGDEVTPGPTVDDLIDGIRAQTTYETSEPIDVTIGGYRGKRVDIVSPPELFAGGIGNAPSCDGARYRLWGTAPGGEGGIYVQGPANRWQTNVLDVNGVRLVVVVQDFPGTSPADRAALDAIVESLVIEP